MQNPLKQAQPTPADPLPTPTLTAEYLIAAVTTIGGLFATQGLISNGTEKLITGVASVVVPLVFVVLSGLLKTRAHTAKANVLVAAQPLGSVFDAQRAIGQEQTAEIVQAIADHQQPAPSAEEIARHILADAIVAAGRTPEPASPAPVLNG